MLLIHPSLRPASELGHHGPKARDRGLPVPQVVEVAAPIKDDMAAEVKDRKAYMRAYMAKKRAEAKLSGKPVR